MGVDDLLDVHFVSVVVLLILLASPFRTNTIGEAIRLRTQRDAVVSELSYGRGRHV